MFLVRRSDQIVIVKRSNNSGLLAGLLGCIFAILGIFTLGILFVPIAVICSLIGILSGVIGRSSTGVIVSLLAGVLSFFGFVYSPTLWLVVAAAIGLSAASSVTQPKTEAPLQSVITRPALPDKQPAKEFEQNISCPIGGNATVLKGIASQKTFPERGTVWVLTTDSPFCLTLNPPIAPRQRALLSLVEIEGTPPPAGVRIELQGTLYASDFLPDGTQLPRLKVTRGKRLDR